MKCLCCNKEITAKAVIKEGWHDSCIKKFFGVNSFPNLGLDKTNVEEYANREMNKGLSIAGVQKKLSLHLSKEDNPKLTIVNKPSGFILKCQSDIYGYLPEAEHLAMNMARLTGINVVPFALVNIPSDSNKHGFITKRIDREDGKILAMEDFCQLGNRLTDDKYKSSAERCGKIINQYSSLPKFDLSEFFLRVVFSFVIGNSDMHLKNYSLIETDEGSEIYVLSKAYDLLPVNICCPSDKEESALPINGKKTNIRYKDFIALADSILLDNKVARRIISLVVKLEPYYLGLIDNYPYLPSSFKESFKSLLKERIDRLKI